MLTLGTTQPCLTEPEWLVGEGGDYEADTLVECYRAADPSQKCAFYAQFISTGEYPQ